MPFDRFHYVSIFSESYATAFVFLSLSFVYQSPLSTAVTSYARPPLYMQGIMCCNCGWESYLCIRYVSPLHYTPTWNGKNWPINVETKFKLNTSEKWLREKLIICSWQVTCFILRLWCYSGNTDRSRIVYTVNDES